MGASLSAVGIEESEPWEDEKEPSKLVQSRVGPMQPAELVGDENNLFEVQGRWTVQ